MDTPAHRVSDSYVDDYIRLDPIIATMLGIPGYDDQLPDLSPDGHAARAELPAGALRAMGDLEPGDDGERDAKALLLERLGVEREVYDAGLVVSALNVIASPAQEVRQSFDLMPAASSDDWRTIATRMSRVPEALASYRESLRHAA